MHDNEKDSGAPKISNRETRMLGHKRASLDFGGENNPKRTSEYLDYLLDLKSKAELATRQRQEFYSSTPRGTSPSRLQEVEWSWAERHYRDEQERAAPYMGAIIDEFLRRMNDRPKANAPAPDTQPPEPKP